MARDRKPGQEQHADRGGVRRDAKHVQVDERALTRLEKVTPRVASLPDDLLRHQLLITRASPSDAFPAEIVDDIFLPLVART